MFFGKNKLKKTTKRIVVQDNSSQISVEDEKSANPVAAGLSRRFKISISKKIILIFIGLILIAVVSFSIFVFKNNYEKDNVNKKSTRSAAALAPRNGALLIKDKSRIPAVTTQFADKFVPDFSDMRGYAENGDEHWYASFMSIIRTNKDSYEIITPVDTPSITSYTDVAVFDGQVWIGGQGGVGKYNHSDKSIKTYLDGINNTKFAYDKYDDKLYVMSADRLYVYEPKKDNFNIVPNFDVNFGVIDMYFDKKYIVINTTANYDNHQPVFVFDKESGNSWTAVNDWRLSNKDRASAVRFITVNGVLLAYGRDVDYTGCSENGIKPATVVYSFKDGVFSKEQELSDLFQNNEAGTYSKSVSSLVGNSCSSGDNFVVDLELVDGKVVAKNKRVVNDEVSFGYYSYADKIFQLEEEIGFSAKIEPQGSAKLGDGVYALWQSGVSGTSSFAVSLVATQGGLLDKPVTIVKESSHTVGLTGYTECNGSPYAIEASSSAFAARSLVSITKINNGNPEVVYTHPTTKPVIEGVNVGLFLSNSDPICVGNKIIIMGTNSVVSFDTKTNLLTNTSLGYGVYGVKTSKDKDGLVFLNADAQSVVTLRDDIASASNVKLKSIEAVSGTGVSDLELLGVTDKYVAIAQRITGYGNDDKYNLYSFSMSDGSQIIKTVIDSAPLAGESLNDSSFAMQYEDGKTQVVDYLSHRIKTISKVKSIVPKDNNWSITKKSDTKFIVSDDGYLWFNAEYWGLIGYKL